MKVLHTLQQLIFPYTCIICSQHSTLQKDICLDCLNLLPKFPSGCEICARHIPHSPHLLSGITCGKCISNPPHFDRTLALFSYVHPIDKFIINLKFNHQLIYAKLFGELFVKHLKSYYKNTSFPELVIPIPLHQKRLKQRGFNQVFELAKSIKKHLNIKIDTNSCIKIKNTPPQSLITFDERKVNIKNSFKIKYSIQAKHVAILDDVMTTGHTVNELSKTLKKSGMQKIDVWCIARTF